MKKQKINCEKAHNISIVKALEKLGHFPKKESEQEAWFLSPLRSETQASFKVSKNGNRSYDHGHGIGGNVIDLIVLILNCSIKEALEFLNEQALFFSFQQQPVFIEKKYSINIIKTKEIEHPALIQYLNLRKISGVIARQFCQEIWYSCNDKQYFAIGLQNEPGGWELRNKFLKNCSSPKTYTYLKRSNSQLIILEGLFDLFSLVQLQKNIDSNSDIIVSNAIAFIKDIEKYISNY